MIPGTCIILLLCIYAFRTGSIPVRSAIFGEGNGSILLDNLMCDGHESSLFECVASDQIGIHNCEHNEDAGVRCEGMSYLLA